MQNANKAITINLIKISKLYRVNKLQQINLKTYDKVRKHLVKKQDDAYA